MMKQPERRKSCFKCCNMEEQFSEGEGQKGRLETVRGGMGKVEDLEEGGRTCQVMCNVSEGAQSTSRQQKPATKDL